MLDDICLTRLRIELRQLHRMTPSRRSMRCFPQSCILCVEERPSAFRPPRRPCRDSEREPRSQGKRPVRPHSRRSVGTITYRHNWVVKNGRFRLGQKHMGFVRSDRRDEPIAVPRTNRSTGWRCRFSGTRPAQSCRSAPKLLLSKLVVPVSGCKDLCPSTVIGKRTVVKGAWRDLFGFHHLQHEVIRVLIN